MTENPKQTIGFIGAGSMASSIIGGMIAGGFAPSEIHATCKSQASLDTVVDRFGIVGDRDNQALVEACDIVVLAVKPHLMGAVAKPLRALWRSDQTVISVAAGIPMSLLERWLGDRPAVMRVMPNTPSLLGVGAAGLLASDSVDDTGRRAAEQIFSAVGMVHWLSSEAELDALTSVSGSGPAYYFAFMEAMIKAGQALGLSRDAALALTVQTAVGAAKMAAESGDEPATLRRKVTSPNGTTQAALETFASLDLNGVVESAMRACVARAGEMSAENVQQDSSESGADAA